MRTIKMCGKGPDLWNGFGVPKVYNVAVWVDMCSKWMFLGSFDVKL